MGSMIIDLDGILAASKPGDEIRLGRGLFTTLGCSTDPTPDGQPLKPGVKLIGSGPETIITCVRSTDDTQPDVSVILGSGDNLISNLTIDCNVFGSPNRKRNGVYCRGKNNTVSNVHVTRPHGVWSQGRESFGIAVQLDDEGSSIVNCRVSNPVGTYHTLIQGNMVDGCSAEFNFASRNETGFRMAYNVGKSRKSVVRRCRAAYATAGVYCDEPADGILVEDCEFICVRNGLFFNAQQPTGGDDQATRIYRNVVYRRNNVYLDPTRQSAGILLEHSKDGGCETTANAICSIDITENSFNLFPGIQPSGEVHAVNVASFTPKRMASDTLGITKIRFTNNEVDPRMKFRNYQGNADIEGTVVQRITFEA